jgi:ubiquitin-conjugating enzyme E2 variant
MIIVSFIVQIALGWLLADFLSGLLHWVEDRFGRADMPLLGKHVFLPNLLHHQRPTAFLEFGFIGRNWTTWLAASLVALPLLLIFGPATWLLTAWLGGMMTNEVHAWAHRKTLAPRWALPLQRIGVIQSPAGHARHHVPPHVRGYCILTDWLNPVLDRTRFWTLIELPIPARWFSPQVQP